MQEHKIIITNRKELNITGVTRIESLHEQEFVLETVCGYMAITGENLDALSVNIDKGEITIVGVINSVEYFDELKDSEQPKSKGVFGKLFKK